MDLETHSAIDLGVQDAYYRYREPNFESITGPAHVTEHGNFTGFTASATWALGDGYFITPDFRYAFGDTDYSGSGTLNNLWTDTWETRLIAGRDFIFPAFDGFPTFGISPYAGLGYRTLYNDARGITSSGSHGYRRDNELYYFAVGMKPRFPIDEDSRLTVTLELDPLLHGEQMSYLSDAGGGDPNLRNEQNSGLGYRGDIMYETKWWSLGPYFMIWDIGQSSIKAFHSPGSSCGASTCYGIEPNNNTLEVGLQAKFHILGMLSGY